MVRVALALTPALTLALVGCAANSGDEGMIVLNMTAPPVSMCMFTGAVGQPTISQGQISIASPVGYQANPLIASKIAAGTTAATENARTIFVEGANVSIEVTGATVRHADGSFTNPTVTLADSLATRTPRFSGSIAPAGAVNVSFELLTAQAIASLTQQVNPAPTDRMTVEVVATMSVFGKQGGDKITAEPFTFPITVCNDCVVVDHGACPLSGGTARQGNACNVFQDGIVDCCEDPTSHQLICPGTM